MNETLRLYIRALLEKKELILEPDENPEREKSAEDEASSEDASTPFSCQPLSTLRRKAAESL